MVRLVYASKLSEQCGVNDLKAILNESREGNRARGITGILCHDSESFMQWLEGPRDAVNGLFRDIVRDERHESITLLDYREVAGREFESWSMAYVTARDADAKTIFKYSPDGQWNPLSMGEDAATAFLVDLARERNDFLHEAVKAK
jgi:hypothetical protein